MNELESALNTISNKKKLSKELEMIKEKLKDLAIESPSSSEEEDSENNLNNITK